MLSLNQIAPNFSLPDQFGKMHQLEDYRHSWLLIYFYPKDMTPGCTAEACSFRDNFDMLKGLVTIVGVSTDSESSHAKFATKYELPFTLLSDEDKQMVTAYEAYGKKKFMGREFNGTYRVSYLINPEGKIAKVYPKVDPKKHVAEVFTDLHELQ